MSENDSNMTDDTVNKTAATETTANEITENKSASNETDGKEKTSKDNTEAEDTTKHRGRFSQVFIYLGKLFRMFIFQNDWKVLPMSAIISGLVSFVVGANLFKTQEGTLMGTFALACICIWNGFFNSIQVICRERPIVKREHRSGMHISAYISAHMIYQAFLCLGQTIITIIVCKLTGVAFPKQSLITSWAIIDIGISLFLITYCADIMALMVSSIVHTTTTAMTIMPFLLIFQLVFSGGFFQLNGDLVNKIKETTISKWGLTALCSQGNYNSLQMVTLWNAVSKFQDLDASDYLVGLEDYTDEEPQQEMIPVNDLDFTTAPKKELKPIRDFMVYAQESGAKEQILNWSGRNNQNPNYAFDANIVLKCWRRLILFIIIYASIAVISLEFIDRDKR